MAQWPAHLVPEVGVLLQHPASLRSPFDPNGNLASSAWEFKLTCLYSSLKRYTTLPLLVYCSQMCIRDRMYIYH